MLEYVIHVRGVRFEEQGYEKEARDDQQRHECRVSSHGWCSPTPRDEHHCAAVRSHHDRVVDGGRRDLVALVHLSFCARPHW